MSDTVKRALFESEDPKIVKLLADAAAKAEKGDSEGALEIYKSVLLLEPENVIAKLGKTYAAAVSSFFNNATAFIAEVGNVIEKAAACGIDQAYVDFCMEWIRRADTLLIKTLNQIVQQECVGENSRCRTMIRTFQELAQSVPDYRYANMSAEHKQGCQEAVNTILLNMLGLTAWILLVDNNIGKFLKPISAPEQFDVGLYEELAELQKQKKGKATEPTFGRMVEVMRPYLSSDYYANASKWVKDTAKTDNRIDTTIEQLETCIRACRRAARAKYWEEHPEEKAALEAQKADIEQQIQALEPEFEAKKTAVREQIDAKDRELEALRQDAGAAIHEAEMQIQTLVREKKALGLFKFKEKRTVQDKIDLLEGKLLRMRETAEAKQSEIQAQKSTLEAQIGEIDAEKRKKVGELRWEIKKINDKLEKGK